MKKFLNSFNTIKFKLFIGILAFMVPVQILLVYSSFYAIRVTQNQVAVSYRDMISLYMNQIDDRLREVDEYLYKLIGLDHNVLSMKNVLDETDYMSAKVRVYIEMSRDILIYDIIDSLFIYSVTHDDFVQVFDSTVGIEERIVINRYIRNMALNGYDPKVVNSRTWHARKFEEQFYILNVLKTEDLYIGAWTRIDSLKPDIRLITIGESGASFFINENAIPMSHNDFVRGNELNLTKDLDEHYFSGANNEFLIVGERSGRGDFSMVAAVLVSTILQRLPFIQRIIFWVSIAFVVLLPMYFYLLRKTILMPLKRMIQVMKKVRQGDLHSRIEIQEVSEEFRVVNDTFNKMMAEISELKISIYEEKIGRQNTELMYLQMQVNPHFFLNTLNILYSLARTQKYGLIQEMVMCLIKHFRYMFKKDSAFVSLEEELQHVENYIKIQQMRFTDKIKYEISVPDFLLDLRIPSLLIVMFVENSVKYAITPENTVCIKIAIDIEKRSDILYLKILIEDTGIGFDEEILEKLRNGQTLSDDKGDHIGIRNVQRRLEMMYSDRAYLNLENCKDGGASVEILIPADYMGMNRLGCEL